MIPEHTLAQEYLNESGARSPVPAATAVSLGSLGWYSTHAWVPILQEAKQQKQLVKQGWRPGKPCVCTSPQCLREGVPGLCCGQGVCVFGGSRGRGWYGGKGGGGLTTAAHVFQQF